MKYLFIGIYVLWFLEGGRGAVLGFGCGNWGVETRDMRDGKEEVYKFAAVKRRETGMGIQE